MEVNPLHLRIGQSLSECLMGKEGTVLLRDGACGGAQHIPLFCSERKSRETEYCNVDLMILKDNKIKVIIEIEESNVKPTQVCGKFLTSALSKYHLHHSTFKAEMDHSVTFIQILDTSALNREKTRKTNQWDHLAKSINEILPLKGSKIQKYVLLGFNLEDFDEKKPEFISVIDDALE